MNPFEQIFDQVVNILELAVSKADQPPRERVPSDLYNRLNKLERDVDLFCKMNRDIIIKTRKEAMQRSSSDNLPEVQPMTKEEEKIIKRAQKLLQDAEKKRLEMERARNELKNPEIRKESAPKSQKTLDDEEKAAAQERRKKFKRVGANKKWKPL